MRGCKNGPFVLRLSVRAPTAAPEPRAHSSQLEMRPKDAPTAAPSEPELMRRRQPASLVKCELSVLACRIRRPWDGMVLVTKQKENNTKEWLLGSLSVISRRILP